MRCKHHPKYNPASGEPTEPLIVIMLKDHALPCPYCWQARAKWLNEANGWRELEDRIAGLEEQLVKKQIEVDDQIQFGADAEYKMFKKLQEAEKQLVEKVAAYKQLESEWNKGQDMLGPMAKTILEAGKREAVLKADLAKSNQLQGNYKQEAMDNWATVREVKADFAKFAGHTAYCALRRLGTTVKRYCDCGLAKAQERWK